MKATLKKKKKAGNGTLNAINPPHLVGIHKMNFTTYKKFKFLFTCCFLNFQGNLQ